MRTGYRCVVASAAVAVAAVSLLLPSSHGAPSDDRTERPGYIAVLHRYVVQPPAGHATDARAPTRPERRVTPGAKPSAHAGSPRVTEKTTVIADRPAAGPQVAFGEHKDPSSGSSSSASSSAPCPKATTCKVYALQNSRWRTDSTGKVTIRWKFNDEGRRTLRAPPGLLESALKTDMAEWHKWNSNLNFAYAGTTTATFGARGKDGSCADGNNVIGWAKLDPDIIAETLTCMEPGGRYVRDADLALNVTYHWEDIQGTPKSRHSFDIRSIVMHELGHVLSLAHPDPNAGLYQTMMGNAVYGETRKRTPALGDVLGLQAAYPCGSSDSCPRTGIADD